MVIADTRNRVVKECKRNWAIARFFISTLFWDYGDVTKSEWNPFVQWSHPRVHKSEKQRSLYIDILHEYKEDIKQWEPILFIEYSHLKRYSIGISIHLQFGCLKSISPSWGLFPLNITHNLDDRKPPKESHIAVATFKNWIELSWIIFVANDG